MKGVNRVILLGTCGKDAETRYSQDGKTAFTSVSIATTEKWKDKVSGQPKEATEWHNLSFAGRIAEIAGEYLKKGSKVYVEGKIKTRKWQDGNGQDRYTTEIHCTELQLLDSAPGGSRQPAEKASATAPDNFDTDMDLPF